MKKLTLILCLFALSLQGFSTNVSGGIYSNTTWTLAGSPYIVTGRIVVFQNDTLTIEPGVVVKFDRGDTIEIRGNLLANGTAADSIIFTSNLTSPKAGDYYGIYINTASAPSFRYCEFFYASNGIYQLPSFQVISHCSFISDINTIILPTFGWIDSSIFMYDSTGITGTPDSITNCVFTHNGIGMQGPNGIVTNCTIKYNTHGIYNVDNDFAVFTHCIIDSNIDEGISGGPATFRNCEIKYNSPGITGSGFILYMNDISDNTYGIITGGGDSIVCNSICNNSVYNLEYWSTGNMSAIENYWCLSDSAHVQATIYDGHQNLSYGLVFFMPIDTISCIPILTGTKATINKNEPALIYPNPSNGRCTIQMPVGFQTSTTKIEVYNILGKEVLSQQLSSNDESIIDMRDQPQGIYFYRLVNENQGILQSGKLIFQR